jgi:hypothetical protein
MDDGTPNDSNGHRNFVQADFKLHIILIEAGRRQIYAGSAFV